MNVVVVGMGYVGITACACIATAGHQVLGVDTNLEKVETVLAGRSPITEPGIDRLIEVAVAEGKLSAAVSLPDLAGVDCIIVCVGTPSAPDGSHNMGFVAESARQIAHGILKSSRSERITVAFRSTFRPGTMEDLIAPIFEEALGDRYSERVELVYNPEFLRESTAIEDYFAPPKIVIGTEAGVESSTMAALHEGVSGPVFVTRYREAEITKFVDNTWHAVKVAFANEVGRVCHAYGVDASVAHEIFVADTKLNISPYYTRPGGAFGGSCLPKDVRAMQHISAAAGVTTEVFDSLLRSNRAHMAFQLKRVTDVAPPNSRLLIAGLAFKAGTDDMRESPNVTLVAELIRAGYHVRVFDPAIHTSALVGQNLGYVLSVIPQLRDLMIDTEAVDQGLFDYVVANNATANGLPALDLPLIDLRGITV
jgi:GDP-mannose 6-dehydrogenase